MLLCLIAWLGGLIFFPVVAETAFAIVSDRARAGSLVGRCLVFLDRMGMIAGVVFLLCSLASNRLAGGRFRPFGFLHLLILLMLGLTLTSEFAIIPRMDRLRAKVGGEMSSVPLENPVRAEFDALHRWSTRAEGGVLLLGLAVVYLTSRRLPFA
jgi:hypothetical protein